MTSALRKRITAVSLTGVAAIALAFGGAAAAHADGAPTTGYPNLGYVTFSVPDPGADDRTYASLEADIFVRNASSIDISAHISCNDEISYPVSVRASSGALTLLAHLPLPEVGHVCFLSANTRDGRTVAFSQAQVTRLDDHRMGSLIWGQLVTVVRPRGGAY
ncbi:hypothetical protein [Subtercola sp. YIM 133946]|uniref:hypothetical protein n=1 Tax=Subtercola sp. YIM 133946 TaxID=3118909 RepID=UPI002F91DE0F